MLLRVRSGPDPTRFAMETLTGLDRLLRLFSSSPPEPESSPSVLELHEHDIFGSTSPSSSDHHSPCRSPNANPNFSSHRLRVIHGRNFGILAALPDQNPNPNLIPMVSSAMTIPAKEKKVAEEQVYQSSAPVRIPVVSGRSSGADLGAGIEDEEEEEEEEMMMPPHEIVARREGRGSSSSLMMPMTSFSVLEGAGRTLKGRDLRRVRNAVFRTMGFED